MAYIQQPLRTFKNKPLSQSQPFLLLKRGGGLVPGGYGIYLYYTSTLLPALLKTYSSIFIDGRGGIF